MKTLLRCSLVAIAVTLLAPVTSFAQSCPPGYIFSPLPGGGFECLPEGSGVPEVSASESSAGLLLVAGIAMVIRGRKRVRATV